MAEPTPVSPGDWENVSIYFPPDPCTTAPNGTGARCTCMHDCVNYWMRAHGLTPVIEPAPRKNWVRRLFHA